MKRFILMILVMMGWLVSCQSGPSDFTIEGVIENAGIVKTVVLYEGDRKLDSAFLTENGRFVLKRMASQPRLFRLKAGKFEYPVILNNGEKLSFRADLQDEEGDYEVSGSLLSEKIKGFAAIERDKKRFQEEMDADFVALSAKLDPQAVSALREEFIIRFKNFMDDYIAKTIAFAKENDNLAGFYAMTTLDREFSESELIAYADKVASQYPDNVVVQQFVKEMEQYKRLAVGQPAPLFESLTPNNKTVRLEDFKGKYTLVDFWASWCVPCREENPNIVQQYNRFKDKGFTVLGVSLDGNPGSWLKAVEEDGLPWTQVSDLQAWKSELIKLYDIKAIPTSFLLDPEGIIIAKNLRGKELEDFLVDIFK